MSERIANSSSELYPVVIWTNGLVESEIEKEIEDEIGYNRNGLEVDYTPPSKELISELEKAAEESPNEYLETLMKKHLEMTSSERKVEKEKTNLYRQTRRRIVEEKNTSIISDVLDEINIDASKTRFISRYAPMAVCFMTAEEVITAEQNEMISELSLYEPQEWKVCVTDFGTTKATMEIDKINNYLNLTGDGEIIGIYETATVNPSYYSTYGLNASQVQIIGPSYSNGSTHSTYCAGIAAGSGGVAPDAIIHSSTCEYDWQNFDWNNYGNAQLSNLEALIDSGVSVISISWGSSNSIACYNNWAKYTDYLISDTNTTIVCATGNNDANYVMNPSSAYNCIAVNGFVDVYNGQSQKVLNDYSYNNGNGCLKPDVIGPSLNNGTSTATPYIAGMLALMYQYKPGLAASPELSKAILMASCHQKCSKVITGNTVSNLSETMQQGLTDRQGAGIPSLYRMISIISQHTYGKGILKSDNSYERIVNFVQPQYNSENINVVMTYLQNNVPTASTTGVKDDYNISLTNDNTTTQSTLSNSSAEMIYQSLSDEEDYSLRIYKNSGQSSEVRYAYAWSTDMEHFNRNVKDEGIYYLRNKKSGLYLTKNQYDNKSTQTSFIASYRALWIVDYISATNKYTIKNGSITSYGLCLDSIINGSNYYAVDNTLSNVNPISVLENNDGTYTFTQVVGGNTYALSVYQNSTSTGAIICWSPYSSNNNSQRWYFEAANYRIGDVHFDRIIDNSDVYYIQAYDAGSISLNNIGMYLADVNKNDVVTVADAVALQSIIANP